MSYRFGEPAHLAPRLLLAFAQRLLLAPRALEGGAQRGALGRRLAAVVLLRRHPLRDLS